MRELIRFLTGNPVILLVLVIWILGAIGSMRQAIAKARAEAAKRGQRGTMAPPAGADRMPSMRRGPKSAEEIAAEIRRAMRLDPTPTKPAEPEAARRPAPREVAPPPTSRRIDYDELPQRPMVDDTPGAPRRTLVQELEEKDRRAAEDHLGKLADRKVDLGGSVRDRKLDLHVKGADRRAHRRRPSARILDLNRPASVFLAGEVFGRPLALRDDFGDAPAAS